jgi:hypothetical protein
MQEHGQRGYQEALPTTVVAACAAGLGAGWLAAGSTGLVADPLRVALTWGLLAFCLAIARLARRRLWLLLCVGVMVVQPLLVAGSAIHEVLLVTAVLALLAASHGEQTRRAFAVCAFAAFCLACYRLALTSVPLVWHLSDAIGSGIGRTAAWCTGRPLEVGATFGGVDYLVTMAALWLAWLLNTEGNRLIRGLWAVSGILAAHFIYVLLLAFSQDAVARLPDPPEIEYVHPYVPPDWHWVRAAWLLIPWNLPLVGALPHLWIVVLMFRWARWKKAGFGVHENTENERPRGWWPQVCAWVYDYGTYAIAVLLAVCAVLSLESSDLRGKRFVALRRGFSNWEKPEFATFGQLSAGQFGMLPHLVESLGGELRVTENLKNEDLDAADVVLLLHPSDDLPKELPNRLRDFVRQGGGLLVVGEPHIWDGARRSGSHRVLTGTSLAVQRDVAVSEAGRWNQSLQPLTHGATRRLTESPSMGFSDSGSSLRLGWWSLPLVTGRWGWSDFGSDSIRTASAEFEPGERLGDLVLAAERRLGRGAIVLLADDAGLTNEGLVFNYEWAGQLFSYLAHQDCGPQSRGRPLLSFLLAASLVALLGWQRPAQLVQVALLLALSISVCQKLGRHAGRVIPEGTRIASASQDRPNRLAYIDASHLPDFSRLDWGFDAINGLALTLMRDGYLTVAMPEWSRERLERAAIVVSVAPARTYTAEEVSALGDYVQNGGIFICTVGAEGTLASRSLLARYGIRVPASPVPTGGPWREPEPMGRFRSLYLDARDYGAGEYKAGVRFYAGWPIEVNAPDVEVLVRGQRDEPIVVARRSGRGAVVVIGDAHFALNKNLEYITGDPFDGRYENAAFWRWLLSRVTSRAEWVPPLEMAGHADEGISDQEASP